MGYNRPVKPGRSTEPQVIQISNFLLGMLMYDGYGLRIFTQGAEAPDYKSPDDLYLIIAKDSIIKGADGGNITQMCRLSITKPEYKAQYHYAGVKFKLNDAELADIKELLCSYNFQGMFPVFAERFVDPHYTVFTNYLRFLNEVNGKMQRTKFKNWVELPLDMAVPNWKQDMEETK